MQAGARRAMTNGRPSSSARSDQPASTGAAGDDYVVAMCARALGHPGPFRCGRSSVQGEKPRNLLPVDYYSHSTVVLVPASNIFFSFSPFFPFFHSLFSFFLVAFVRSSVRCRGVLFFFHFSQHTRRNPIHAFALVEARHPTPSHAIPCHPIPQRLIYWDSGPVRPARYEAALRSQYHAPPDGQGADIQARVQKYYASINRWGGESAVFNLMSCTPCLACVYLMGVVRCWRWAMVVGELGDGGGGDMDAERVSMAICFFALFAWLHNRVSALTDINIVVVYMHELSSRSQPYPTNPLPQSPPQ